MKNEIIVLEKGQSITFLGYTIKNSLNNDGLVLSNKTSKLSHESHLGNYGTGTADHIQSAKKDALIYYMLARPEVFANTLCNKIRKANSGTYHEFYLLKHQLQKDNLEMPEEITCSDAFNCMIYFEGKPLTDIFTKISCL